MATKSKIKQNNTKSNGNNATGSSIDKRQPLKLVNNNSDELNDSQRSNSVQPNGISALEKTENPDTGSGRDKNVRIHYPHPTWVSTVIQELSKSLGWIVIMDPSMDRKIQVFCPKYVDKHQAEYIFSEAIRSVGLRLLSNQNGILRIAAKRDSSYQA